MAPISDLRDEARMIASIVAGESHLFHELIRPYERRVYVMALSFRNLASFRGEAKFGTWLVSITLNEARSRIRHRDTIKMESLDEPPDDEGPISPALLRDWREIPSEVLERKEVSLLLHQAVTALPPIYREVFTLRDVEGMSVNEAAGALDISIASVKVRLHRARMMLQKTLAPQLKRISPKRRWWTWS